MSDVLGRLHARVLRLQAQVGEALETEARARSQQSRTKGEGSPLWAQLRSDAEMPGTDSLDVLTAFNRLDLRDVLDERGLVLLPKLLDRSRAAIDRLLDARSPADVLAAGRDLIEDRLRETLDRVGGLVGGQLGILLSFVTTLRNLTDQQGVAEAVRGAYLRYFFQDGGYEAVDGTRIASPAQCAGLGLGKASDLRGAITERTGERYVRDLVRLLVEAVDDVRYDNLPHRVAVAGTKAEEQRDKLMRWCRGTSSIAESQVMGAVEQATQGVGAFQSNPLIAAAAGTFAGTAARKAAQHLFLSELGV